MEAQIAEYKERTVWMKWTRCWFCGQRYCVNNYPDHKVRIPKVHGVPMCPFCSQHGRGEFLALAYLRLAEQAREGKGKALTIIRAMPCVPKEFRKSDSSP